MARRSISAPQTEPRAEQCRTPTPHKLDEGHFRVTSSTCTSHDRTASNNCFRDTCQTLRPSGASATILPNDGHLRMASSTSYDRAASTGCFRDSCPGIRPAGTSATAFPEDSAARSLQPEIFDPSPSTPVHERRYRRDNTPGDINVHWGLKDQRLPGEHFRYGVRSVKGTSAEEAIKAGQLSDFGELRNSMAERVYESAKREPLGKSYIRGHAIKTCPEGFGLPTRKDEDAKETIYPVSFPRVSEDVRKMYRKTHQHFYPGEQVDRQYSWPDEVKDKRYRFGIKDGKPGREGEGVRLALNSDVEDDGSYKRTRIVQRTSEDYRDVTHAKLGVKKHYMQGSREPSSPEAGFGKQTTTNGTARACIQGFYSLEEQLPDQDLGRCVKPGRRNVTMETRPFGVPSVRSDLPLPLQKSIADEKNYGDELASPAVINPGRFSDRGINDFDFLLRRPKEELRSLVSADPQGLGGIDFDRLWEVAKLLFDDNRELVSLDALLHVYGKTIDADVRQRLKPLPRGISWKPPGGDLPIV